MAASDYVPIFFKNRLHLEGRPQMSTRHSLRTESGKGAEPRAVGALIQVPYYGDQERARMASSAASSCASSRNSGETRHSSWARTRGGKRSASLLRSISQ